MSTEDGAVAPARDVFPWWSLPSELRLRIMEMVLLVPGRTIDLDPTNYRVIRPRLSLLQVSHRMHDEACPVFYGSHFQAIRVYPIHGRFFHTKKPLLARLGQRYRAMISTVELRLGPGWSAPPKCWNTNDTLGLKECTSLRTLKIFIECDPSDDIFHGFRGRGNSKDSYKIFCIGLLQGIIDQVPSLKTIELDAYPSVGKSAPMVLAIVAKATETSKTIVWGPLRGWEDDEDYGGHIGLEKQLAALELGF